MVMISMLLITSDSCFLVAVISCAYFLLRNIAIFVVSLGCVLELYAPLV